MVWTPIYRREEYIFFCQWPIKNSYWFCVYGQVTKSAKWTSQGIFYSAHTGSLCFPEVSWPIIFCFHVPQFITVLGIFAPTPFIMFFHNLLQQTLVFFNGFGSALIFKSPEEHYVPKHYVLHSHTHITLCSARHLLGSQEMLFLFKR